MLKKVTKKFIVSNVMIIIVMVFNGQFIFFFSPYWSSSVPRMIIICSSPHTTELGVTSPDPIEIDFVVELLASAN